MKYMLLFEKFNEIDWFYQSTLDDKYWTEISHKYPSYNDTNDTDFDDAVEYIYTSMMEKYPNMNWDSISVKIKNKIKGGIS